MYGRMKPSETNILEATLRLIVRGGVDAVRYRDVAAESGVALGTISYQFSSREELIRSAFAHFLSRSTASLRALADQRAIETGEDLAALVCAAVKSDFSDPQKPHLAEYELIVYAARDPIVARALREWDRFVTAELAQLVERVGGAAPFSTAQIILDFTRGFQLCALSQTEPDFDDFEERVTRLVLALCAPPPVAESASPGRTPRRDRSD
jgi:TetR/AcrR family transcriptional regulator, regulator of biofilm formation and stress response